MLLFRFDRCYAFVEYSSGEDKFYRNCREHSFIVLGSKEHGPEFLGTEITCQNWISANKLNYFWGTREKQFI